MTCIGLGEVFLATAGASFFGPKSVSEIVLHISGWVSSSRLPQELFFSARMTYSAGNTTILNL